MAASSREHLHLTSLKAITALILRIFRVNGALLAAGDRLVGGLGLTSARWQLLGGIANAPQSRSVAQLAREMGNTRQAVQRIANDLAAEGMVAFHANPRHKRAQLVELTPYGRELFDRSLTLQRPWAAALAQDLDPAQISDGCQTLDTLLAALARTATDKPGMATGLAWHGERA